MKRADFARQFALGIIAIFGFILAILLGPSLGSMGWMSHLYGRAQSKTHYILNTGCWTIESVVHQTLNSDGTLDTLAHPAASLTEMLNFIGRSSIWDAKHDHFELVGAQGSSLEMSVLNLYAALKHDDVGSIIYLNYPSALTAFSTLDELEKTRETLEAIGNEYPKAKEHSDILLKALLSSEGYRFASRHMQNLERENLETRYLAKFPGQNIFSGLAEIRDGALVWARRQFSMDLITRRHLRANLDKYAAAPDIPLRLPPTPSIYYSHSGGDSKLWQEFWLMAAEMSAQQNVPFVNFITPMLHLDKRSYEQDFTPNYLAKLKEVEHSHPGFIVSDHALDHDLNLSELSSLRNVRGYVFKTGYLTSIVGQYKRARILHSELRRIGALASEKSIKWNLEEKLPASTLKARWMPESERALALEEPYQPLFDELSRPAGASEAKR